jgi:hypothetical protein
MMIISQPGSNSEQFYLNSAYHGANAISGRAMERHGCWATRYRYPELALPDRRFY